MKKITEDLLKNNNWELDISYPSIKEYGIISYNLVINKNEYFLTLSKGLSNHINRDWNCHIDNDHHSSIASVNIDTVDQFNLLMKLMNINYELSSN